MMPRLGQSPLSRAAVALSLLIGAAAQAVSQEIAGRIEGPENTFLEGNPPMTLPIEIRPDAEGRRATVSIGAAQYGEQYPSRSEFFEAADRAMYQAKQAGRNSIQTAPDAPPS